MFNLLLLLEPKYGEILLETPFSGLWQLHAAPSRNQRIIFSAQLSYGISVQQVLLLVRPVWCVDCNSVGVIKDETPFIAYNAELFVFVTTAACRILGFILFTFLCLLCIVTHNANPAFLQSANANRRQSKDFLAC